MQTEVTYSARPPWNEVDRLDIGEGLHHASAAGYANQVERGTAFEGAGGDRAFETVYVDEHDAVTRSAVCAYAQMVSLHMAYLTHVPTHIRSHW
jgi:hypothetical protein